MKTVKLILAFTLISAMFFSCAKDLEPKGVENGFALELSATFEPMTRVVELPVDQINVDNKGLKNIGLYIYYASDYGAGVVNKPYVRNMECKLMGNQLVPLSGELIYVYDKMTLVAFYPYNGAVNDFNTKSDELEYPITMGDYSQQKYIPYRAEVTIDPTVAYRVNLSFQPKQTSKIEVVLVGEQSFSNPKILPAVDPSDATGGADKREVMVDITNVYPNSGGGSKVTQYTAYVWTSGENDKHHDANKHFNNIINKGDIIFQSDELTLTATQTVNFAEQRIYRYGYNLSTGEVFIPTSSKLVHDLASLTASPTGYQVCDIDLSSVANWTPLNLYGGSYDGGGHKIKGMQITSLPVNGNAGLFGQLQGGAVLSNVNLVSPVITINAGTSVANVGALCAVNNFHLILSPADIAAMRAALKNSLPPGVADPVIDAMLADEILKVTGGTSVIKGCKVSDAVITLTGKSLKAGIFCGKNGDKDAPSTISDSYASGVINANIGVGALNDTCSVAGFVGVNNTKIATSYTTAVAKADAYSSGTPPVLINRAEGFCKLGSSYVINSGSVTSCFTVQSNTNPVVSLFSNSWPSWGVYTDKWPIYGSSYALWLTMGEAPSNYPKLVWER